MEHHLLNSEDDIQSMREMLERLPYPSSIPDFEENVQMESIRQTTRLWVHDQVLCGFAYVDDYNNLWYELDPRISSEGEIGNEIIFWGEKCIKERNQRLHEAGTLDFSCELTQVQRTNLVLEHGFCLQDYRTLRYERSLELPIESFQIPEGFTIRQVRGIDEIEALVRLHRAAFESDHMTSEERLAIMNSPYYRNDLDLVVVTANEELAAFCVCGFYDSNQMSGYTDPIGTHPNFQRKGLGKAIIAHGLKLLKANGAKTVELGTSSENISMQRLAELSGFIRVSEKLWFSKAV